MFNYSVDCYVSMHLPVSYMGLCTKNWKGVYKGHGANAWLASITMIGILHNNAL